MVYRTPKFDSRIKSYGHYKIEAQNCIQISPITSEKFNVCARTLNFAQIFAKFQYKKSPWPGFGLIGTVVSSVTQLLNGSKF